MGDSCAMLGSELVDLRVGHHTYPPPRTYCCRYGTAVRFTKEMEVGLREEEGRNDKQWRSMIGMIDVVNLSR